jgi:N-acetylglutamate synthase-like GNAT family acetyltransferase
MWEAADLMFVLRRATSDDVLSLETLIAESARGLGQRDYSPRQIEAAIGTAWAVDRQLIQDGTFWIAEVSGEIIGCGGWSRRRAVAGASATVTETDVLSPANDAARIRAFFVHPRWARRGIGTALLKQCEEEARAAGFRSVELLATLSGERLYASRGYSSGEPYEFPLGRGQSNTVIPMRKLLHDHNDGSHGI